MKLHNTLMTTLFAGLLLAGLSGCEREGPAEKAGKAIDDAASDVADTATEAKEAVEKKMED